MNYGDRPADLLRLVIANAPVVLWTVDAGGIVTMAVGQPMTREGLRPETVVGRPIREIAARYPGFEDNVCRAMAGESVQFIMTGTGGVYDMRMTPLRDAAGKPAGLLGVAVDITDRFRAQEEVRRSKALLQSLFDAVPHGMFVKDREGRFVMMNRPMAAKWGLTPQDMLGQRMGVESQTPSAERQSILDGDRRVLELGETVDELRPRTFPDGMVHQFHSVKAPIRDAAGAITGVAGIVQDVTAQKAAESQARLMADQFRDLVEGSVQGIVILRNNRVLFANQAIADMLGYENTSPLYALESIEQVIAPEDIANQRTLAGRLQRREPFAGPYEVVALRRDGRRVIALAVARMIHWQGQSAAQITCIDITERRRAEAALREKEWQLTRAQEAAHIGTFYRDSESGQASWSNEMYRLLGLDPGAIPACLENFTKHVHPDERSAFLEARQRALDQGQAMALELRMVRAGGAVRLMRIRGEAIQAADGKYHALAGLVEDITDTWEREAALQASEVRYRNLVEGSVQGMVILRDYRAVFGNLAAAKIFGFADSEHMVRDFSLDRFLTPDEWKRIKGYYDAGLRGERAPTHYEVQAVRTNGNTIWLEVLSTAVNWMGAPAVQSTFSDITERRQSELELRASQKLLRQVIDAVPMWIFVKDTQSNYLMVNKSMADFFGVGADVIRRMNTRMLPAPSDIVNKSLVDDEMVYRTRAPLVQPTQQVRSLTGRTVWYHSTKLPLFDDDGALIGLLGVNRDITEQLQAEESLRLKDHAIASSLEAIAFADMEWKLREVNAAFVKLWGLRSAEEAHGRRAVEFWWNAKDIERATSAVQETGSWAEETVARCANGTSFPIDLRISTVRDSQGQPVWRMASAVDISQRKQAEETQRELEDRLFQAQKMESVGRLAGGIAHDFNNMLTPMLGYAELAMTELEAGHPAHKYLQVIRSSAERAADLTRQLLALGRRRTLRKTAVNVTQEIDAVTGMLRRVIPENVSIRVRTNARVGSIHADATLIHQLVMNLALNARDAMPNGGTITIEARNVDAAPSDRAEDLTPGPHLLISVTDEGHGMDRDTLDRAFEPFFTTKVEGQGTGLGLAVVYGIVKQHGGHIAVSSEVGRGSRFDVWLPRLESAATATVAEQNPSPAFLAGAETVLVVEDNGSVRTMVTTILKSHGYTVLEAATPTEARARLHRHAGELHLVLCDVVLPEMSGPEFCRRLTETRHGARVLFMSGHPKDLLEQFGVAAADVPLLDKPFSIPQLLTAVRQVLDGAPGTPVPLPLQN